ncbi:unnamed protein product [Caenorhabditis brenneri]
MSSEFPYPSFKCILEYLEANKRIHICSRSKALQKIDKKIPLHIKHLEFLGHSITVNGITISVTWENLYNPEHALVDGVLRNWNQVLMPGDVCMKDGGFYKTPNTEDLEVRSQKVLELKFYKDKNEERRVAPDIPQQIAMKKIATVLFGGRCSVHVSNLTIQSFILRLPAGLNFRIKNTLDIGRYDLNEITRIVDPESFPLKTIKMIPINSENYYHPIVQTAETLQTWPNEFRIFQEPWQRAVLTFPHKHIKLRMIGSVHEKIISVVQDWLNHPRENGKTLELWDTTGGMIEILYQIKKQFNGRVALISGNNNKGVYPKAVIIPIDSTSEILISSVGDEKIKLESIPTGTVQPTISSDLTHPDVMWLIHICSRSKALQKIDKKIPLHIKSLDFYWNSIIVNDIEHALSCESNWLADNREQVLIDGVFRDWYLVIMPGDVNMTDREVYKLSNTENLEIRNQKSFEIEFIQKNTKKRRAPPNIPYDIALKKIATVLFGGRCSILASKLGIHSAMLRLPVGFNISIRNSLDIGRNNLNEILCIIDPQSFPLKTIRLYPYTPETYYHPAVQTAETLDTFLDRNPHFQEPWHRDIMTFPHKHIKLRTNGSVYEVIIIVIQDWLNHPREHGRTLSLWDSEGGMVEILYQIKNQFNGTVVRISGNENQRVYPKAVIIPIDSTSELLISSVENEGIKLESISTGTIQPTIYADMTHPDVMWIHICSRSKAYQKIDKKIPLHIKRLYFCWGSISVNDITFSHTCDIESFFNLEQVSVDGIFRNWDQVVMPGDVSMGDGEFYKLPYTENLEIRNQKTFRLNILGNNTKERRVPPNIPYEIALKKVANLLFGGRCLIHVSELVTYGAILRLPVGFNIRIRNSLDIGSCNIDDILRIIDPQSFPLKTIKLYSSKPENHNHPIVQTAETLEAVLDRIFQEPWRREILTFPHKHIKVTLFYLDYEESVSVVQDWVDHPREHGRTFTMKWMNGIVKRFYQINNRFNGNLVLVPENNNKRAYQKAIIIPIDSTSELFISVVKYEGMKIECVPTGTIQSTVYADLTYEDVFWWRWRTMSSEITYPIFKCILEYLEANKRIHICSRSKALQKIDKKIPLHIKRLEFYDNFIAVNNILFSLRCDFRNFNNGEKVLVDGVFRNWNQVITPGDVRMGDREFYKLPNTENLEIRNQKPFKLELSGKSTKDGRVAPNIPFEIALKKIATALFGERYLIHVSELVVSGSILRLPVGFNIRIRNTLDIGSCNIDDILRVIDPQSFPLKAIKMFPHKPEDHHHPIVQAAETLETVVDRIFQEPWHMEILTFPHKHIIVNWFDLDYEESVSVVQDWLDHPREHGRTFTMGWTRGMVKRLFQIKKRFNGNMALLPKNNDKKVNQKAVIIPIDSASELLISVNYEGIKLESIPTGTIQMTVHDNSHWSRIKERFEEDENIGGIIFISAFLDPVALLLSQYDTFCHFMKYDDVAMARGAKRTSDDNLRWDENAPLLLAVGRKEETGEPMTYPALRCVVEYLEANKRMYICSRTPQLEKIEKSIPLRLDTLTLYNDGFKLNDLQYSLTLYDYSKEQESARLNKVVTPGDITLGSPENGVWIKEPGFKKPIGKSDRYVQVMYEWNRKYIDYFILPNCFELNSALKHLACFLFEGRPTIIVKKKFKIDFQQQGRVMRLPENFKVLTRVLNVKRHEFNDILPILDSSCFPLKRLKTGVWNEDFYKSPYIRSCQKLVIKRFWREMDRLRSYYLSKLSNKELICDMHLTPIGVMPIINNWLKAGRAEGTKMTAWIIKRDQKELWDSVIITHEAKVIGQKSSSRRFPYAETKLLVPMSSTTQLLVYQSHEEARYGLIVTLEVVSNAAAADVVEATMKESRFPYFSIFILALLAVLWAYWTEYLPEVQKPKTGSQKYLPEDPPFFRYSKSKTPYDNPKNNSVDPKRGIILPYLISNPNPNPSSTHPTQPKVGRHPTRGQTYGTSRASTYRSLFFLAHCQVT